MEHTPKTFLLYKHKSNFPIIGKHRVTHHAVLEKPRNYYSEAQNGNMKYLHFVWIVNIEM